MNHFSFDICDNLAANGTDNYTIYTQEQVSRLLFFDTVAYSLPTFLSIFLLGSWSDFIGRKGVMMIAIGKYYWLVIGWLLVGYWLVIGWLLVSNWLVIGWLLVGYWLVIG